MIDNPSTIPNDLLLVLSAKNFPFGKMISKLSIKPSGIISSKFSSKTSFAKSEILISDVFALTPPPEPGIIFILFVLTIFFNPFPQTFTYDAYVINIGPVGIDSYHLNSNTLKLDQAIPNPSNNECKIQFVTGKNMDIEFRLTNLLGEIVEVRQINASRGVNDILLNTSEFTNGVYLYSIKNGDNHLTKR